MSPHDTKRLQKLIEDAEKDRYALIIPESEESFAKGHLREILRSYPCTGVLVKRESGGMAYHMSPKTNRDSILKNGPRPCADPGTTYGDGAIYAFPGLECYQKVDPEEWSLFELIYGPGCLQAIATFDRPENEQYELLIFPEALISCKEIPIPAAMHKRQQP